MGTLTSGASVGVSGRRQRVSPRPSPRASFKAPTSSGRGWGEQGLPASDLKRFESEACVLEGALFEWFLRDVVISAEFRADERSELSSACLIHFDRLHLRRFTEYSQAFEATSSLQTLGAVAWLRIVGGD